MHCRRKQSNGARRAFTLVEIMIVVAIIGVLLAIAGPTWVRQRRISQQRVCQENLSKIDGAKDQWAIELNKQESDVPDWNDLAPADGTGYIKRQPACPAGGSYTIGQVGTAATCSVTSPYDHNEK